jgi:enoyl-CoA hydratase/carnithine racemase
MPHDGYACLRIALDAGVATLTIDHPPIQLFDLPLMLEMDRAGRELEADPAVRVVVVQSADPDFFIAHADVNLILGLPAAGARATEPSFFQKLVDRFRTMPKPTLAKLEGICRGGGSELVLSMDMRFAALGRAVLAQPEVAVGILPGGSGTQRLPRLAGRGRALELILGCEDLDAATAERWGLLNRALPPAELRPFVERLARRIASFPPAAVAAAKRAVLAAESGWEAGLLDESLGFQQLLRTPEAQRLMRRFLERGGQTRDAELRLGALCAELADS